MMKILIMILVLSTAFLYAYPVTNENFESGASGWNNNTTTTATGFSQFLGRFGGTGGAQSVYKTFALSGTQTEVTIQFDFYEIDTWDGERLYIYINDSLYRTDPFWVNSYSGYASLNDTPSIAVNLNSGTTDIGFLSGWSDEFFRYTIVYNTTANALKLGFGTTLDEPLENESWGIDNVIITQNNIPEPMTFVALLVGFGLLMFRKR